MARDSDTSEDVESELQSAEASATHDTLKYHLLGPSLTKAGQDAVDQQKVSDIIYNASRGSKFFNHEEARDKILTEKIQRILEKKKQLEGQDLSADTRWADGYIAELELGRDLSQTVVHIDCDAFFAAVEELDRPELRDVPMAVGRGVITTCNYVARKSGCRSGMASFVAKKLCPNLICLPQNFEKYNAKAQEIRTIISKYDSQFESASIDEAYLNITQYCADHSIDPQEAVQKLRDEVLDQAKITVSAGIAANAKIAKIASNWNKPNGQFLVPNDRGAIMNFMADMPVRKVNGIGRVFERELGAIGIKTCGDIFTQRGILSKLLGKKAFQFLMQCYLGLGRTKIEPIEKYERKSVGTEHTFGDLQGMPDLQQKLRWTAEELEKDLIRTQFKGRTLVLKIKLHTFEVISRQTVPPKPVYLAQDLYNFALPMLARLNKEKAGLTIRLMGLRCTHLVSMKKPGIDFFGGSRPTDNPGPPIEDMANVRDLLPEEEFEAAAIQERLDDMNSLEALSQDAPPSEDPLAAADKGIEIATTVSSPLSKWWDCPVCSRPQRADDRLFNRHVDFCLSRQTIKDAVHGSLLRDQSPPRTAIEKRKAVMGILSTEDHERRRRRPFFS